MADEFHFNNRHDAETEIRAAVRYLLREASGADRGDIVRQIHCDCERGSARLGR
jgi:hypothetical protein